MTSNFCSHLPTLLRVINSNFLLEKKKTQKFKMAAQSFPTTLFHLIKNKTYCFMMSLASGSWFISHFQELKIETTSLRFRLHSLGSTAPCLNSWHTFNWDEWEPSGLHSKKSTGHQLRWLYWCVRLMLHRTICPRVSKTVTDCRWEMNRTICCLETSNLVYTG